MASKLLDEALTISRQTGIKREIAWNLLSLAGNQTSLGELDRADANLLASLEVGRQSDDVTAVIAAFGTLGPVCWLQGNPARAREQYEQALSLARELSMTWGTAILRITLGDIALAEGDRLTAFTWYRQGLEELKLQAPPARMAHALRHYAGLQCASGDYRGAAPRQLDRCSPVWVRLTLGSR